MNSVKRMIDNALLVCPSKSAIARALNSKMRPQDLYAYEIGSRHMPSHYVMKLATLANMNAVMELGRYEAEWLRKKAERAAAGIAVASFSLVALSAGPGDAKASPSQYPDVREPIYALCAVIVAWLQRKRRAQTTVRQPVAANLLG